jgi:L-threonylcarbamoyladenylate synthase
MEIVSPNTAGLIQTADALKAGKIVAYPTESVYGLGVDPFNAEALESLYRVKGRDESNPVLMIVSNKDQLKRVVEDITPKAQQAMKAFWPGPLSILFPAKADLSELLLGKNDKVCVRLTSHPIAEALCRVFDGPIVSTSANLYSQNPAKSAQEIDLDGVAVCIDGGIANQKSSTVFEPDSGTVLREGSISRIDIANALF